MTTDNMPPHTTLAEPIRKYAEWYARAYAAQQIEKLWAEINRTLSAKYEQQTKELRHELAQAHGVAQALERQTEELRAEVEKWKAHRLTANSCEQDGCAYEELRAELDKSAMANGLLRAEVERHHQRELNARCVHCGGTIFIVVDDKARQDRDRIDAEHWRKHLEVLRASTMTNSLHIEMRIDEQGKCWKGQKVLSTMEFGRDTILGVKAVGLTAERMAQELNSALEREARRQP